MQKSDIYQELDGPSTPKRRGLLMEHLRELVDYQKNHPEESADIAYQIAGLMSAESIHTLPDDDPLMQIFWLAGILELPKDHHAGASWQELRSLIKDLK